MAQAICVRPMRIGFSTLVTGAGAAVAGIVLGALSTRSGPGGSCAVCGGEGYVDCVCTASGRRCSRCSGSGRRRCPRCRGGGTGVHSLAVAPIPVRIDDGFRYLIRCAVVVASTIPAMLRQQYGAKHIGRKGKPRVAEVAIRNMHTAISRSA